MAAKDISQNAVKDNSKTGLEGLAAIIIDGFTDFTPTQLAILRLLSQRGSRVVITLPCTITVAAISDLVITSQVAPLWML